MTMRSGDWSAKKRRSCLTVFVMIRTARADDLASLQAVEVAAGEAFRSIGMDAIADDEPPSIDNLAAYAASGRAWAAADSTDEPVGYIIVDELDGCVHIAQVTVHPLYSRQGIGRRLIERAASWGAARQLRGLTLTTFEDVPWNASYYRRLGFQTVPQEVWSEGLRLIVESEADMGLAAWPRVVMKRGI